MPVPCRGALLPILAALVAGCSVQSASVSTPVAGGHGGLATKRGDYVIAFALPQ